MLCDCVDNGGYYKDVRWDGSITGLGRIWNVISDV